MGGEVALPSLLRVAGGGGANAGTDEAPAGASASLYVAPSRPEACATDDVRSV